MYGMNIALLVKMLCHFYNLTTKSHHSQMGFILICQIGEQMELLIDVQLHLYYLQDS